jgi:ankyrin repeat protein
MPSPSQKGSPGKKGSPSRTPSPKKLTPLSEASHRRLYDAAVTGNINAVNEKINLGANVNWANLNFFGNTPLIAASRQGHANVVKTLLQHWADVNKANNDLETPIFKATESGNVAIVEMLIFHGADVNKKNYEGYTPLHRAAFAEQSPMKITEYIEIIKLLLNRGANINAQNTYYITPLHIAASRGNKDIVLLLLKNGADIKIKNRFNKLASEMARENHFPDIAEMIEKWPTLYALAAMEDNYSLNRVDTNNIKHLYQFMGGKRTTRGKRILGRKTRSNCRRRN